MPVNKPKKGESKQDYLNYCIPIEVSAGKEVSQATAICISYYDKDKMSKMTNTSEKVMAAVAYNTKFRGINLKETGDPCWENYEMIGMKDDGTPNCVPIKLEVAEGELNILGYHTKNFKLCPGATSLFNHLMEMPMDEETMGMVRSAAQAADNVFHLEDIVLQNKIATQHQYEEAVILVDDFKDIMREIDEEVGMNHDVSFMDRHVEVIEQYLPTQMAEVGPRGGIKESPKAPKSDTKNPDPKGEGTAKGDASGKRGAKVTAEQEKTLEGKVKEFNERASNTKNGNATLGALKSVFQRGLGAFNTSHSPKVQSAEQWAYARVNAFLYLLKNGRPENPKYDTDYDLLPKGHPKAK
jgi:hypothetical protein